VRVSSPKKRAISAGLLAIVGIWALGLTGYYAAKHARVTPEKLQAFVSRTDLRRLSGAERAAALRQAAEMLNRLSLEDRREMRMGRAVGEWFNAMTEAEKGEFIEATLPTGFKQMITAFEELPEDKRRRAVDQALKRLREQMPPPGPGGTDATNLAPLSPELEAKVRTIGLKAFYSQSSAQTKAELAPLLEELQRNMESGRLLRGR